MQQLWFALIALTALFQVSYSTIGLDAIPAMSESTFKCLWGKGYRFFIGRAWRSNGLYDTTGIQNIKNARAAGWTYVDAYLFPCLASHCAAPANQVKATIEKLQASGAKIGMLWLDIEIFNWPSDQTKNRQTVRDMVAAVKAAGVTPGIYSNYNNWKEIVGLDFKEFSSVPLWWARYNGVKDLTTGFTPFGGWTKPAIHQYSGDVDGDCSVNMDQNYY